jgi:hypothetical protein
VVGPRFVCPYFTNAGAGPPGDRLSAVIKRSVVKTRKRERYIECVGRYLVMGIRKNATM